MADTLKCALCGKKAATAVMGALVCEDHYNAYREEGRRYLPRHERKVYLRITGVVPEMEED